LGRDIYFLLHIDFDNRRLMQRVSRAQSINFTATIRENGCRDVGIYIYRNLQWRECLSFVSFALELEFTKFTKSYKGLA
jgi:hypothetical protein